MNELITSQPVVVLTGAGASKWLDKATTFDIYDSPEYREFSVKPPVSLLNDVRKFLKSRIADEPIDLEYLLDYVDGLIRDFDHLWEVPIFQGMLRNAHNEARKPLGDAQERVLDFLVDYYSDIDREKAVALYGPLFEGLRSLAGEAGNPQFVTVFTLNYDEAVESAADDLQGYDLVDGFRSGFRPLWNTEIFDNYEASRNVGADVILFKLHGSVSWTRPEGADRIERTVDVPRGRPRREHVVLYPSASEKPIDQQPFATAYAYLEHALRSCRVCVFIGTSFRDHELVDLIRSTSPRAPLRTLIAMSPSADPDVIAERIREQRGRVRAVSLPFAPENVPTLIEHIESALASAAD